MTTVKLTRLPSLKTPEAFGELIRSLNLELNFEPHALVGATSALTQPLHIDGRALANRWAVQPMEGWDGTTTGGITESMLRRWARFGQSGAKLIWGGEAMAVRPDGRANPNQLVLNKENQAGIARLREELLKAHAE